ncbi:hypothetical protein Aperf_G00000099078 [Anoplocephala perfoliata]
MEDFDQKLEDLPIESIKRICACLDTKEMVGVCLTLPGWDYVLTLPYNKKKLDEYVHGFHWLDKRLCELLSEESSTFPFSDVIQAILYRLTEESRDASLPTVSGGFRPAILAQLDFSFPIFSPPPINMFRHFISPILDPYNYHLYSYMPQTLETYSFTLYVIPYMPPNIYQFEALVDGLATHSVLLIVLLKFSDEKNAKSDLQLLIELHKHFRNILRRLECISWRICCVELAENEARNAKEAVDWACRVSYCRYRRLSQRLNKCE